MWKRDSVIDTDLYCEESTKVPQLHMKYMEFFSMFSLMKKEKEILLKQLIKEKWLYYKGKAPSSVYKEMPFDLKLTTRDEIDMFIDADEEVGKMQYKVEYIDQTLNFLEGVLRQLNNRTYQIKNAIEWEKFKNGL
ncbi:putative DNA repair/recombination [Synechococcus phage syn9]|uniref:DNA repair/recombination n=1 Tax=Synechococcus phage syn9 TaxID=382359 RepID=Q0QZ86_BPSYS|nr:UvsY-like recombination mediator [Synechococcus phage syn9]ABA47110.1 putative DNA repair/recombination [Synechococcus phage syn9]AGH56534.1 UvsY [Cyanophage Syn10]